MNVENRKGEKRTNFRKFVDILFYLFVPTSMKKISFRGWHKIENFLKIILKQKF